MTLHKKPGFPASHISCDAVLASTPDWRAVPCLERLAMDPVSDRRTHGGSYLAYARTQGWKRSRELGDRCPRHQPRHAHWGGRWEQ